MSGVVKVVVPLVQKVGPVVVKYAPHALSVLSFTRDWLDNHPGAPSWVRTRAEKLHQDLVSAMKKKTVAGQIRASLAVIRDLAHRGGFVGNAAFYLARADGIEQGVRLAELQKGGTKKATLVDLKLRTDALAAELFLAVVDGSPALQDPSDASAAEGREA